LHEFINNRRKAIDTDCGDEYAQDQREEMIHRKLSEVKGKSPA
jgi:hypothetical protein